MGKIVSNFFMSLDGVVEAPDQWHMPYFNEEMGAAIGRGMETNRGFLSNCGRSRTAPTVTL